MMVERKIIRIDDNKCNGCGLCIPNCPEGALQMIDGKARLISDLFCDGLGACIGHCPQGAIDFEVREADVYDEKKVMENIIKAGSNTIKAHLSHLKDHNEVEYFNQALEVLKERGIEIPKIESNGCHGKCPGSQVLDFQPEDNVKECSSGSNLAHWPIQLHLVPPNASFFKNADILLSADCVAHALSDFQQRLKGKALAIACPKLDANQEIYKQKIISMIDDARANTMTVMTMEVPCCGGLLNLVRESASKAMRKIPIKHVQVGIKGDILSENWI